MSNQGEAKPTVAVLDGGYGSYEIEEAILRPAGYELRVFEGGRHDTEGKFAFAQNAAGIFIRWTELGEQAFKTLPALRCVVRYGVGYDNVDLEAATRSGVLVCNVQGYANHAVSDHALALALSCLRGLTGPTRDVREDYGAAPWTRMPEINRLTLGIVGLGRIGGTLAVKARGLFARVLACDPYISPRRFQACGAIRTDFPDLLKQSDVISIHCNLTRETRLMFGAAEFGRIREHAVLINTARGPIVDEESLLDALESGKLSAAGLDVFHDEPPLANRDALLAHPRVIATGHYAWYSSQSQTELQRRAARNMLDMLQGRIPEDCLNADLGKTGK